MDEYGAVALSVSDAMLDLTCPECDGLKSLQALPAKGQAFRASVGSTYFTGKREWRYSSEDSPGENRADNHFQGMQRCGDFLLLSGGDWNEPAGHLFVIRLNAAGGVPRNAKLERVCAVETQRPHAGGIHRLGNLLAVPFEGKAIDSVVKFLYIADPSNPVILPGAEIIRKGNSKASAAAIARLRDGRLLIGVAWANAIDLYLSKDDILNDGYIKDADGFAVPVTVGLENLTTAKPGYQSIAFLPPSDVGQGKVRLPLIATRNTHQVVSDFERGENWVDLIDILLPIDLLLTWPNGTAPSVELRMTKQFKFGKADGNFSAASGIDVQPNGQIALYAGDHWRRDDGIHFSICSVNA